MRNNKLLEVVFGLIAGTVSGMGMGGGTILILLLSAFMNFDQHVAQATNLVFFIPTSIAAIIINFKQKNIDLKVARVISICGVIGAVVGAIVSDKIETQSLKRYFAIFILLIAVREIYSLYKEYIIKRNRHNK